MCFQLRNKGAKRISLIYPKLKQQQQQERERKIEIETDRKKDRLQSQKVQSYYKSPKTTKICNLFKMPAAQQTNISQSCFFLFLSPFSFISSRIGSHVNNNNNNFLFMSTLVLLNKLLGSETALISFSNF